MRLNIQSKLTLTITVMIALILTGIYVYLKGHLHTYTYQRIRSNLLQEATFAKLYFERLYRQELSIDQIDQIADEMGAALNLRLTIVDKTGKVWGDSELEGDNLSTVENHLFRPEIQSALTVGSGEERRFSTTLRQQMLYVAFPFQYHQEISGVIRLAVPLVEIELIEQHLRRILITSLLAAFFLSIIMSFFASQLVSKPIQNVSMFAREIALGNFDRKLHFTTNDEIQDLAKSINDMAEQIRAKIQEMLANKTRLEAVLFSMFEGVMVVDHQSHILLMNEALLQFLHIERDAIGKKSLTVIRNVQIQELIERILKKKSGVEKQELSVLFPEKRVVLVHATPIHHQEKTDGAVLVFHDITELRRLEQVRKDFVANVSHELRTPVATIKGYAETLLDGALEDKANARDFVQIIYTDAERLAKLVNDLLDLSKIESDKVEFNFLPQKLETVVTRVIEMLAQVAKEKSVMIQKTIPDHLPPVLADETSLTQILFNLVENAVKYNQEGGSVHITAESDGSFVKIHIADTGIGIPEKDLPRIFERFYRVDKAHSRQLGGTGLGLSIVKHLIQAHQGEISVESILGQGSIFHISLPKA